MWRWLFCLALMSDPAAADWQYLESWYDDIGGFETKAAATRNEDGFSLHIFRNPIGRVYFLATLPHIVSDLPKEGVVASLKPSGGPGKDIEARTESGRIVEYASSTGRAVRERLWHGEGQAPAFGTLREIIDAGDVTMDFFLADGTTQSTTWLMTGSGLPIAQALGIDIDNVSAGMKWDDAAAQSLLAAMTACQFPKLDVACIQKVTACSVAISEDRDINAFETCVAED